MMKKFLVVFICIIIQTIAVFAEEKDETSKNSAWGENSSVFNSGFENQEAVSDTKLHKVIEQLKERNLSRKQRKIQKEVNPLSPSVDIEHLKDFTQNQDPDNELSQTLTVMIPVRAYSEEGI